MIFKKKVSSTRKLLNLKDLNDNNLTGYNNHVIYYYQIAPFNLSVLSKDNIHAKIFGMMNIIKNYGDIEILVLNNRENYGLNKEFLRYRIESETNSKVKSLLEKDLEYIDKIQVQTATARSFLIALRFKNEVDRSTLNMLSSIEKAFMQNGFMINKLSKEELKTLLGVYYEQNVTTIKFEDKDGERWFKKKNFDVDKYNTQTFLDSVTPSIARFYIDHFILGNTYRSVWAIRQYPTQTEEQALLRHLGDKENVTLKIYSRVVTQLEERKIIQNATNKNKMKVVSATQLQDSIESKEDLLDLNTLIADMHRSKEPLVHTAVFIEMMATNLEDLKLIEANVFAELSRSKINVDKLLLRQKEGLLAVSPSGYNPFKEEFERVMPAKSVANLFPFNYSGKTDDKGWMGYTLMDK